MAQLSLFPTRSLRDRTLRRNYSEEVEAFRREHARQRSWGLTQRHARRLRQLSESEERRVVWSPDGGSLGQIAAVSPSDGDGVLAQGALPCGSEQFGGVGQDVLDRDHPGQGPSGARSSSSGPPGSGPPGSGPPGSGPPGSGPADSGPADSGPPGSGPPGSRRLGWAQPRPGGQGGPATGAVRGAAPSCLEPTCLPLPRNCPPLPRTCLPRTCLPRTCLPLPRTGRPRATPAAAHTSARRWRTIEASDGAISARFPRVYRKSTSIRIFSTDSDHKRELQPTILASPNSHEIAPQRSCSKERFMPGAKRESMWPESSRPHPNRRRTGRPPPSARRQ
jgi:hypothetical protein